MKKQRKSFRQQELEEPEGQLNALWWRNIKKAMGIKWSGPENDEFSDFQERVRVMKSRADETKCKTGRYPDEEVSAFLDNLE
jgi:hypothetical protein